MTFGWRLPNTLKNFLSWQRKVPQRQGSNGLCVTRLLAPEPMNMNFSILDDRPGPSTGFYFTASTYTAVPYASTSVTPCMISVAS